MYWQCTGIATLEDAPEVNEVELKQRAESGARVGIVLSGGAQ
jgi:hypothetical protein